MNRRLYLQIKGEGDTQIFFVHYKFLLRTGARAIYSHLDNKPQRLEAEEGLPGKRICLQIDNRFHLIDRYAKATAGEPDRIKEMQGKAGQH